MLCVLFVHEGQHLTFAATSRASFVTVAVLALKIGSSSVNMAWSCSAYGIAVHTAGNSKCAAYQTGACDGQHPVLTAGQRQ